MCDQQRLRPACAYAQTDQSLCLSLEYSMTVELLTEHCLEFLNLTGGYTGSSESTLVKMSNCWKSRAAAHMFWDAFSCWFNGCVIRGGGGGMGPWLRSSQCWGTGGLSARFRGTEEQRANFWGEHGKGNKDTRAIFGNRENKNKHFRQWEKRGTA